MFALTTKTVDAVQILELGSYAREDKVDGAVLATSATWKFEVVRSGFCSAEQAGVVWELWDKLQPDETARCHTPGYAIQAYVGREVVFSAALCWNCNNISIGGRLACESWREFNAAAPEAQELLTLCQVVVEAGHQLPNA